MTFIFFATTIIALVVICLLWSLLSQKEPPVPAKRDKANIEVFTLQLSELAQDLENENITDAQFQQYRLQLETQALDDIGEAPEVEQPARQSSPFLAVTIALFIPLLSLSIYSHIGNSEFGGEQDIGQTGDTGARPDAELQEAIVALERRVEQNPDDAEGRMTLGYVYAEMGRYADAAVMYEELLRLRPTDADTLVNYADALARAHGNRFTGQPAMLLTQALEIAPEHERALWLAGFAEIQANNREQASAHWRRLLEGMESGSEIYMQVEKMLANVGEKGTDLKSVPGRD